MIKKLRFYILLPLFAILLFLGGCAKHEKKPEDMSFDDLKTKALTLLDKKRDRDAIVYLEQLISKYPENQYIFEYKFILADLYLKVGRLDEAYGLYKHYTELYPSEEKAETAHYKSILAKFYQTLKVSKDCDDTDTQQTVKRCKLYLSNDSYSSHKNDVRDIKYTCERRLIDKEIYVFNTYLRRKKFNSAKSRIDYLKESFLNGHPDLEAQILFLEGKLAHKQKDRDLMKNKIEVLAKKYPESRFTRMAQNIASSKRRFIF